jgi:NTP pyrophosphatase (non-canonical NTP hydrolase)
MNPWHPMTDARDLKTLGKLGEELGECSAAVARCIIQGINEAEPVTGKVNKVWLEEEIADVLTSIHLVRHRFDLDRAAIEARVEKKLPHLTWWHEQA